MKHFFDTQIAKKYGIVEAIIMDNMWFWITKNIADEKYYFDGRFWTYGSNLSFANYFEYLTPNQIRRAIDKLVQEGILIKGNYNQSTYDRTNWYAFTDFGQSLMQDVALEQKTQMHLANLPNGVGRNAKSNIYNNYNTNSSCKDITRDIINKENSIINNTIKESKKAGNNYDTIINDNIQDESLKETLYEFIKMRTMIKKPLTDRALQMIITKLRKLSSNNNDLAIEILNQSIINNWQDIYELKSNNKQKLQVKTGGDAIDELLKQELEKERNEQGEIVI